MEVRNEIEYKEDTRMIDAHVHIFGDGRGEYSIERINSFIVHAQKKGINEIYMLEHTHQYSEFVQMYKPISDNNEYLRNWLSGKMKVSLEEYTRFIDKAKAYGFPIKVRFGLEVCYIPETVHILSEILKQYKWDFITGSVHFIGSFGFDHKLELWKGIDVDEAYRRYYEIMLEMIDTGLFNGVGHPDSIKCFGHYPSQNLDSTYIALAKALNKAGMYTEQSGGLVLNYKFPELGMNPGMLRIFKDNNVSILTASDAHRPEHAGMNIKELQEILDA